MPMHLAYVASPYSHPDADVREHRYNEAMRATAWLLRTDPNLIAFSPIVYCHPMARRHALPTDAQYWKAFNEGIMTLSDRIYFLRLPGWEDSIGFKMEHDWAMDQQKPHLFIDLHAGDFVLSSV